MIDIDQSTDFGARAAAHLGDDAFVWLTSVSPAGAPLPTPVWFFWDGGSSLRVQSLPTARRVHDLQNNPHLSLNFNGSPEGGDIVVLSGRATEKPGDPVLDAYIEKYRERISSLGLSPEEFADQYSTALDIELTALHGHP